MTALVVLNTVVVAALGLLVLGLLRSHAEILHRLHDLGAGLDEDDLASSARQPRTFDRSQFNVFPEVPAPGARDDFPEGRDLVGAGLDDSAVTVRVAGTNHRTLVAFLSSNCLTCQGFWDAFAAPAQLGLPDDVRLVVVTKDRAEESPSRIAKLAPPEVPTLASSAAWQNYDVPGSPYFVLVDGPTGSVRGEGTGLNWDQVRKLLTQATDDASFDRAAARAASSSPRVGLEAGRVRKPDADAARERRIDDELLAAGVVPGDPSLYRAAGEVAVGDADAETDGPAAAG